MDDIADGEEDTGKDGEEEERWRGEKTVGDGEKNWGGGEGG